MGVSPPVCVPRMPADSPPPLACGRFFVRLKMSDHLPDNLEDWPEDPFGLLGVDSDVDAKTARRAYARLIRQFKPEHSPEEFQRIRSAYEAVRSLIEIRDQYGLDLTFATGGEDSSPEDSAGDDDQNGIVTEPEADPTEATPGDVDGARVWATLKPAADELEVSDEAKAAWDLAKDGDLAAARSQLEERLEHQPQVEDAIVRLYWLRRLDGDAATDLVKWLCGIVEQTGSRGTPWQLLMTELDLNPGTSRLAEVDRLFETASPERLAPLLQIRWRSAGRSMQWESIERDLKAVRPRFLDDSVLDWAALLVTALRCLVWRKLDADAQGEALFESLTDELNGFQELHLQMPHFFDEVDELQELRNEITRGSREIPSLVTKAVREETLSPEPDLRRTLIRLADEWTAHPGLSLGDLDTLVAVRPVLFGRIWQCLSRYNGVSDAVPEEHEPTLLHLVSAFVAATPWNSDHWRLAVADFCTRECISVETVVKFVMASNNIPPDFANGLAQHLYADAPLRCLTEGLQMLQSV